ncbi:L-cysteine desulfidase [Alkalispirochaeta americana]|uniref:UPF0597 protein SAMN05920897_1331 n=1 Tax=Alkalispirochaeta americana TaxID=159291 RepID=A0A1N6XX89_9SPIO|nr:L-serine ammonia-lyase, iron-sulfur-dependent, subunit alpha [Alkalispirochaeta americana]SIR06829.1 L-cysteine desulfidase [Alkalispirochaeta americana]
MENINLKLLAMLRRELVTSVGCTEPAAVALACATSRRYLCDELAKLSIVVSKDVFKNGFKVGIPGSSQKGLFIAAALGYLFGDSETELEVLSGISSESLPHAEKLVKSGMISIDIDHRYDGLYIKVVAEGDHNSSEVVIQHEHNHVTYIATNGGVIFENLNAGNAGQPNCQEVLDEVSPERIIRFADEVPIEDIAFIYDAAVVNLEAARQGMAQGWGLNIGKTLLSIDDGFEGSSTDLTMSGITRASAWAAAASDARMSGNSCPVVINSGSGNQGITASLPVLSIAKDLGMKKEIVTRALAVSHLMALYQKHFSDRISAFCGVVTAATGAGCGTAYMMGGRLPEIEDTINTALGGISGMICDGAKPSCAMKIALAVQNGLLACVLSLKGKRITPGEGIVAKDACTTIRNIGVLARDGMCRTDEIILQIMLNGDLSSTSNVGPSEESLV